MTRKSFELHAQAAAWTGGIAAAAAGGVLLALMSPDLSTPVIWTLRLLGLALIVALVACGHMQYHAILVVNAYERQVKADVETSKKHLRWSQWVMLWAFIAVLLFLTIAIFVFRRHSPDSQTWTVVGTSSAEEEHLVVFGRTGSSTIRTLTRAPGVDAWKVCEVSPDKLGQTATDCGAGGSGDQPAKTGSRPILQRMGEPIVFDSGKSALKYSIADREVDLEVLVCKAKEGLRKASAGGVIVVGRHDTQRLTNSATRELGSNQTLAQRRAEVVASYLANDSKCGKAVGPVISVAAAPVIIPQGRPTAEALAADRSVDIFGLTSD